MARCKECYSVITRTDAECYICGLPAPGAKRSFWRRIQEPKLAPVTPMSNMLFVASLALTVFSFVAPNTMPVSVGATLGGFLFVARIVSDRIALRNQRLALRPIEVVREDY